MVRAHNSGNRTPRALAAIIPLILLAVALAPAQAQAARTLSIADDSTAEPAGNATTPAEFTVTLSNKAKKTITASFATAPGTAGPLDFRPTFGAVKFKPGKTTRTVKVPVRGDLFAEADETFAVELSEPKRAEIDDGEAEGLIPANDDGTDTDGDDIPDADDCDPADPNPPGALICYVPTTIYDLNQGNVAVGTDAYIDDTLATATADAGRRAFVAIVPGDPGYTTEQNSALELDLSSQPFSVTVQSRHRILGTVRGPGDIRIHNVDNVVGPGTPPAPIVLPAATLAAGPDGYHGLAVEVANVSIASSSATAWLLNEGIAVDSTLFEIPDYGAGTAFETITGHARTRGAGTPSIAPRDLNDIDPTVAMLTGFNGLDNCVLPGETDVTIGEVEIDEPKGTDTVVDVSPDDPSVLSVDPTVTILAGNTTAPVVADAAADVDEDFVDVTATFGPLEYTLFVTVATFC